MNEYEKVVKKAIKHFKNLRSENKVVLDKFEKDIRTGRTQGSSIVYRNRHKYYDVAIEALEMKMPKAPIGNDNGNYAEYFESWLECPECGEAIPEYTSNNETKCYCLGCGQKLNWSEVGNE